MLSKILIMILCIFMILCVIDVYYEVKAVHDHIHMIHNINEKDHQHETVTSDCKSTEECTEELNEQPIVEDEELFDKR